mmetsp:Transcript_24322/g.62359  ORF Transcript_24322/g.62359 Transcript_24322/m.62359 type:complete len:186 (-) Transcript_24322:514-1071(-)
MGVGEWTSSAFVNGRRCTSSDVLNYETLLCGLPQGVGGSLSVVVQKTVGGKVLSSPDNTLFSYDAPVVERLAPDHSPTGGGITITVFGANFGQPDAGSGTAQAPEVLIGDAPCADVVLRSDNELICVAPPGSGGGAPVQVALADSLAAGLPSQQGTCGVPMPSLLGANPSGWRDSQLPPPRVPHI